MLKLFIFYNIISVKYLINDCDGDDIPLLAMHSLLPSIYFLLYFSLLLVLIKFECKQLKYHRQAIINSFSNGTRKHLLPYFSWALSQFYLYNLSFVCLLQSFYFLFAFDASESHTRAGVYSIVWLILCDIIFALQFIVFIATFTNTTRFNITEMITL